MYKPNKYSHPRRCDIDGEYAFHGCTSLTRVVIPESVTSIGEDAFYKCISLIRIVIPESVTLIEERAFDSCDSLFIICGKPNSIRDMIGNRTVKLVDYKQYLDITYDNLERANLSQIEAKGLFELIETRKLESDVITQREILSIFPNRKMNAVKSIMQCIGFNFDQFDLGLDLYINTENDKKDSDIKVDTLRDQRERFLPMHKLSMFRDAVNKKDCTFRTNTCMGRP